MQRNLIRILCLALVLTLCFPMVACDSLGGRFGQLVLDLLKGNVLELPEDIDPETLLPETLMPETMFPQTNAPATQPPRTEAPEIDVPETERPTTQPPATEPFETEPPTTTEPPIVVPDPVITHLSFDELDMWIDDISIVDAFFMPGTSASWDAVANVDDYNVEYLGYRGWVAFYAEQLGTFGYQIDDNEPVYSDDFIVPTEQAVIDAALSTGGKSGARMNIMIPVRDLSGEHLIRTFVRDAHGTVEVLTEFTMIKAEDPYAPVFFVPAADMAPTIPGSPGISDAVMSADNSYVTITIFDMDPYYQLPMINGKGYVASYVAIKYRTSSPSATSGEVFVGSGAGPCGQGDNIMFDLIPDGRWHVAILDLAQAPAVVDGVINYLRLDPTRMGEDNVVDLAYIAAFHSIEALEMYDERFDEVYIDSYSVPLSQWTVSGHCREIVDANNHANSGMVAAGGVDSGALLHQGYIGLGEIDLSQFSKMIVYYGIDGSEVTQDHYSNSANNRIIVTSADQAMTNSPTEDIILAANTYTELGWAVQPLEIDLTGVDYNGPVFVTYDTLPGNFMLISSIELIYDDFSAN